MAQILTIQTLIDKAYSIACKHGFHDEDLPAGHFLMLTITEVAEIVEADRKNLRTKSVSAYEECRRRKMDVKTTATYFERDIKDTLEDEFADACIRLFDLAGVLGMRVDFPFYDGVRQRSFSDTYAYQSITRVAFNLCNLLTAKRDPRDVVVAGIKFLFCWAESMNIDLLWHIEHKMWYNSQREIRHGKKY